MYVYVYKSTTNLPENMINFGRHSFTREKLPLQFRAIYLYYSQQSTISRLRIDRVVIERVD